MNSKTTWMLILAGGFLVGLVFAGVADYVNEALNGVSDRDRQTLWNADKDRRFCDKYCDGARGELIEMQNSPSPTIDPPSLAPVCVCAIGLPAVDTD